MPADHAPTPLLVARGLAVSRDGDSGPVRVIDGADLTVEPGTLTDVTGPSGSGKTTLLLALARLLPGATGDLTLEGRPAVAIDAHEWRTRVAYLPQRASLVPGTVEANLTLPWRLKVRAHAVAPSADVLRGALDRVRLADVALDRDVERLSVGQAARVALLRCTLTSPAVLLLDEPDASLDDESAAEVGALTAEFVAGGGGVVRVRHLRSDDRADLRLRLDGGALSEEGR